MREPALSLMIAAVFLVTLIVYGERLLHVLRRIMLSFREYNQAVEAETTRLADVIQRLLSKANTPQGLSPEEESEANATLAHLRAIGKDPEAPIPPAPDTTASSALPSTADGTVAGSDAGASTTGS